MEQKRGESKQVEPRLEGPIVNLRAKPLQTHQIEERNEDKPLLLRIPNPIAQANQRPSAAVEQQLRTVEERWLPAHPKSDEGKGNPAASVPG